MITKCSMKKYLELGVKLHRELRDSPVHLSHTVMFYQVIYVPYFWKYTDMNIKYLFKTPANTH